MSEIVQARIPFRVQAYPLARESILEQPTFTGAMKLAMSLCKFKNDKDAARILDIDSALLSKRSSGIAPWQVEDMRKVMDHGQNLVPLAWLAHQYGHGLVMLETEAERRERIHLERIAELEMKNRVLIDAINGRTA
jgi:hypothetical protein